MICECRGAFGPDCSFCAEHKAHDAREAKAQEAARPSDEKKSRDCQCVWCVEARAESMGPEAAGPVCVGDGGGDCAACEDWHEAPAPALAAAPAPMEQRGQVETPTLVPTLKIEVGGTYLANGLMGVFRVETIEDELAYVAEQTVPTGRSFALHTGRLATRLYTQEEMDAAVKRAWNTGEREGHAKGLRAAANNWNREEGFEAGKREATKVSYLQGYDEGLRLGRAEWQSSSPAFPDNSEATKTSYTQAELDASIRDIVREELKYWVASDSYVSIPLNRLKDNQ